jgi:hypothetical protein
MLGRYVTDADGEGANRLANANVGLIRFGILALPAAGVLLGVGNIVGGFALGIVAQARQTGAGGLTYGNSSNLHPATNPEGFAGAFGSAVYEVGALMLVVGLAVSIFGVFALFAYLGAGPARRWAMAALVPSVLGTVLILPVFGVQAFALPALARAYSGGQQGALRLVGAIAGGPLLAGWAVAAGALYVVGSALLAVAVWRSRSLPRWSAVPYALSAPLLVLPSGGGAISTALGFLGLALAVAGTGWIAVGVRQEAAKYGGDGGRGRVR